MGDKNSVYVSVGITKKIGQYESLRLDASQNVVLNDGDDKDATWEAAWKEVQDQLENQLKEALKALAK